MGPLLFEPWLRPMVWGHRRLSQKLGKQIPDDRVYGESWEISDHESHQSVAILGEHTGETLRSLMQHHRHELLGSAADAYEKFPWLIKFLDAHDWLSVQVHPDEEAVDVLWPGEGSKTEAWFVLDAAPDSRIYAGLLPDVDESILRTAARNGTIANCLNAFHPKPGDCFFLPAGTVHAVGGGVLLAEIQQTSDATFRLYDWDRADAQGNRRELHIEQAMSSIRWDQQTVKPVHVADYGSKRVHRRALQLVKCRYFNLQYIEESEPFTCGGNDRLHCLIVLDGAGHLRTHHDEYPLAYGQAWLIPASCPAVQCTPQMRLMILQASLP